MSIARVLSFAFSGIEPVPVEVQVQIASGLPAFPLPCRSPNGDRTMPP